MRESSSVINNLSKKICALHGITEDALSISVSMGLVRCSRKEQSMDQLPKG